jgi:glycosyltransferase involved in cell wall biosynthesis
MDKKIKVMVIADHPLSPSGVGTQTKNMIIGLLETGKYEFFCLGGAIKHEDYNMSHIEPFGNDFRILPVDGYGNPDLIRSILSNEKPDILWFMTDPRFWGWLWDIENEIRPNVPMVYYHVWDNYPSPVYNKPFYESNDFVACISKLTFDIVNNVSPNVDQEYLPHAVDDKCFFPISDEEKDNFRKEHFGIEKDDDVTLFFWNNRNARRKQSGTVIWWFNKFLEKHGKDKARLLMHTDVRDQHGQDLEWIINDLGLVNGEVMFSTEKVQPQQLAQLYNAADCTINISDAEGFGLATLESLSCGTPIVVNMTGGLQEQVTDGEEWFGIGIEPSSKAIIGSLDVPYIQEDRINEDDFINALIKISTMSKEERKEMGLKGREHTLKNYNFKNYIESWNRVLSGIHETHGSWDKRKNHSSWNLKEIA